jgi:hypothetical protein
MDAVSVEPNLDLDAEALEAYRASSGDVPSPIVVGGSGKKGG